jgi:hypothetical protein
MALIVFVVGQKKEDEDHPMVVVDGRDEPLVIGDVENGYRASALNFDLIRRREHPPHLDEVGEFTLEHEFGPVSQRAGDGGMTFRILAKALGGDESHSMSSASPFWRHRQGKPPFIM